MSGLSRNRLWPTTWPLSLASYRRRSSLRTTVISSGDAMISSSHRSSTGAGRRRTPSTDARRLTDRLTGGLGAGAEPRRKPDLGVGPLVVGHGVEDGVAPGPIRPLLVP